MSDPRPLGNKAQFVVVAVEEAWAEVLPEVFEIVMILEEGKVKEAIFALRDFIKRMNWTLRAMTLLRAGDLQAAEEVVMTAKIRWSKDS